jgi:hypothetical protein
MMVARRGLTDLVDRQQVEACVAAFGGSPCLKAFLQHSLEVNPSRASSVFEARTSLSASAIV